MEEERVLFDASAYMLLEASGDSESEYFAGGALAAVESDAAAADDAQSCSCGSLISDYKVDGGGDDDDFHGADVDEYCVKEDGGDSAAEEEEEEDGVVDQCCGGGKAAPPATEESDVELMNKGETDKHFWETCLAS